MNASKQAAEEQAAASGSELALSYHGRSILENYHIYQAFALMRDPEANIFDGMSDEDAKFVREAMIDAIIATDLAYHDDHNRAAFQQKVQAGGAASFSLDNDDDQDQEVTARALEIGVGLAHIAILARAGADFREREHAVAGGGGIFRPRCRRSELRTQIWGRSPGPVDNSGKTGTRTLA